ncbi:MAG TPA: YajQ family cyclic di-GMP-binding protein [Dehalococcoidia bacterium]|nr:YajQ family cyclic di-GMP-binding protein [Dehalococcoidia bacterium]
MPKTESFDISTGVDLQEVDNAVNQARRELQNRYDFKKVLAEIEYDHHAPRLTLRTESEFQINAMWEALAQRLRARHVPLQNLKRGNIEKAGGNTVRQEIKIAQAIDPETARKIVKFIKDRGFKKVQAQVQGDEVRVSAPSRDDLQAVIREVKAGDWGIELKFGNYR